jgi:hypothetical protein
VDKVQENPELRQVKLSEAQQYAEEIGGSVFEVSALSGQNVVELFRDAVSKFLNKEGAQFVAEQQKREDATGFKLTPDRRPPESSGPSCCN